jgi:hypothetical protein
MKYIGSASVNSVSPGHAARYGSGEGICDSTAVLLDEDARQESTETDEKRRRRNQGSPERVDADIGKYWRLDDCADEMACQSPECAASHL